MSTVDDAVIEYDIWTRVQGLLTQHTPSITDEDERVMGLLNVFDEQFDYADYALRTCRCGVRIEGYYEYVDHLREVFRAAH